MANKGWDGWPDPEAGPSAEPHPCQDPAPTPGHSRYFWMGTFGEVYLTPTNCIMVPYCGKCGAELESAFKRLVTCCPLCSHCCWAGPFNPTRESLGPFIMPTAPPQSHSSPLPVPDVAAATTPTSIPIGGPLSMQPPVTSCNTTSLNPALNTQAEMSQEVTTIAKKGLAVTPSVQRPPATRGRGRGRASAAIFPANTPSHIQGAVVSASCSTEGGSLELLPHPEPDWAEMDFSPLPTSDRSSLEASRYFSTSPPPSMGPSADTSFWVSPGRADPKKLRTVSRIQRIINIKVYDQRGYFMPYATEWIYDEMEKHLDEWIYGELIRKEGVGGGGLFHSDAVKRERDLCFLSNVVHEWWYGRTILKHSMKSCGKFQEEKHFSLSELISNGGRVDKPHPNYYLSYEDTKSKSCLGKEIHPAS
ncbi:hypothetical protein XELAEV_18012075mg [Xenopus laevis]|uniref:Uncharacterized protein n=1 Tax=Xenopus laevis TaxID=8355 RepID=A0A974DM35_XENLA|nr:hypothetical protein XELAEV_18012075mg [Xenopus laevis]